MSWEYKVVYINNAQHGAEQNLSVLNDLAREGWELWHVDTGATIAACWMRRETPDEHTKELVAEIVRLQDELLQSRRVNEILVAERNARGSTHSENG